MRSVADAIHARWVYDRRVEVLASWFARLTPRNASVLDVGAGDGKLAARLIQLRPDLSITGVDVLVRPETFVPVQPFDGKTIPYDAGDVDCVILSDVLHHTDAPDILLAEGRRVARRSILVKDHTRDGLLAHATLRFMDEVGNARHGVRLPHNYLSGDEWRQLFRTLDLSVLRWESRLGLYPAFARPFFERSLHFVAELA